MPAAPSAAVSGLVLAAGAGRRFGGPKALARTPGGTPWLALAVRALREGGCHDVTVVLGAAADEAAVLVPDGVAIVHVADWASGMAASLRAGLGALEDGPAVAAAVVPVDTPELPPSAVARLLRHADRDVLAQAAYADEPGHPVLLGRSHWAAVSATVRGDVGARPYLIAQGATFVECADLWSGTDHDVH